MFNEVFSRPIRPDFAIVYIGMEFSLPLTSLFVSHPSHFDFGTLQVISISTEFASLFLVIFSWF